jgi:hypothetical protein
MNHWIKHDQCTLTAAGSTSGVSAIAGSSAANSSGLESEETENKRGPQVTTVDIWESGHAGVAQLTSSNMALGKYVSIT